MSRRPAKSNTVTSVAQSLHSAAVRLLRGLRRVDDQSGVTSARLSLLSVLVFAGEQTLGHLARIEQVRAPTMTRLIDGLLADGLIRRFPDPHDRRVVRARVLPKGRRLLLAARDRRVALLAQQLKTLDAEDLNTVGSAATILSVLANDPAREQTGWRGASELRHPSEPQP